MDALEAIFRGRLDAGRSVAAILTCAGGRVMPAAIFGRRPGGSGRLDRRFLVGRTTLAALDRRGHLRLISLGLITEVGPAPDAAGAKEGAPSAASWKG